MKSTIMLWLVYSCLCISFTNSQATNINVFFTADSLYERGQYEVAAIAYERIFFLSEADALKSNALFREASCYKQLKRFEYAYATLSRIDKNQLSDSLKNECFYQAGLCAYLSQDFDIAVEQLNNIQPLAHNYQETLLLQVLAYNELKNWPAAKEKATKWVSTLEYDDEKRDSLISNVNKIYAKDNIPKMKKLKKARRLSMFLPGIGQMYAGYPGKGVTNLSLQLAAASFIVFDILAGTYVTAATVGFFFVKSFYFGGINQLEMLVAKRNYQKSRKYNDSIKTELETILGKK